MVTPQGSRWVIGSDAAGIAEQVGDRVEGWQVGDRVAAMTFQPMDLNGTYARYVNLAADLKTQAQAGATLEILLQTS